MTLLISFVLFIATLYVCARSGIDWRVALGPALIVYVLATLVHAMAFGFRHGDRNTVNPFIVYLLLIITTAAIVAAVLLMSFVQPLLLLAAAIVMATTLFIHERRKWTQRHWIELGCCSNCGYGLRGSDHYCPECNTPIPHEQLRMRRIREEIAAARLGGDNSTAPAPMPMTPPLATPDSPFANSPSPAAPSPLTADN